VAACERYAENCGQVPPDQCGAVCDAQLGEAPRCNELLIPFFDCAMDGRIDCDAGSPRCQPFADAYNACAAGNGCSMLECSNDRDRACSCKAACPNVTFGVECRPNRGNSSRCACLVDGKEVATCQDVGEACGLAHRCCEPIFDQFR
jgi:hypothetical protein